jgi:cell division transport system ATP-binding protein
MLINYNSVNVYQEAQEVLSNVNFQVEKGEFVYLIGKVGSGKSSLLKTLYGELPLHEGEAHVMGFDLLHLKQKHLPQLRRRLGVIFQDFQLLTDRTVEANLRFVLRATGWKNNVDITQRIQEVLDLVGMSTKGYKYPNELSGGEQQRIAIARAILNRPELILADEPTGNLDAETSRNITELLHKVCEQGSAVVMITHNLHLLDMFPGRVYQCKDHHLTEIVDTGDEADGYEPIDDEEDTIDD